MNALVNIRTAPLKAFKSEAKALEFGRWVRRAASEGINSAGGALVPLDFLPELIALRETYGAFRRAAHVVPMRSDLTSQPRRVGGLSAYFVAEGTAPTESTGTLGVVNLVAKKLAVLTRASSELDDDAAIDLGEWFMQELTQALALMEDTVGFTGDATSTHGGIQGICPRLLTTNAGSAVTAASGHDTFGEIDIADLTSLVSKVPALAVPGASWFVSQMGFALTLCRLAATAGGLISQNIGGRNVLTFMGFPVELTQALPQVATDLSGQVMLLFGDLSLCATLGDRREITVARSTEYKFAEDQIGLKGTERFDINIHDLGDATTAGPIVGLVGE